jgi:glycerol-3-phosphate dehydrogenase
LSAALPFGMKERAASIGRMKSQPFDVFVVGGGITGAGVAREAALRGYKVALVDKGDFACSTSSRSSKMVHGGLRYLQYYKFKLVYEALRERHTLSSIANNLVNPQPFLLTVYEGSSHGVGTYRMGLTFYDLLAFFRTPGSHRTLGREKAAELEPLIRKEGLLGGFLYYDYRVDDARLTLANVKSAWLKGAAVANYVELIGFLKERGSIKGVRIRDRLSGNEFECKSRVVVNASGPYTDVIRSLDEPGCDKKLRPTKGVHVTISSERLPIKHAIVTEAADHRNVFAVPWGGYVIIGTTDTDYDGDFDSVHASAADVAYLLDAVNRALPEARLVPSDVQTTYAALRPLVFALGVKESEISREHEILVSRSSLYSIAGGKLTTYRSMADELMDKVSDVLHYVHNVKGVYLSGSSLEPLDGAFDEKYRTVMLKDIGEKGLDPEVSRHLLYFYGSRYPEVLSYIAKGPSLASRIKEGYPYIWAEVGYACDCGMAVRLVDVLARRLHFSFEDPEQGLDLAEKVASMMGDSLGWSPDRRAEEVREYEAYVGLTRRYRTE